jgi:FkbM family methyltransferase
MSMRLIKLLLRRYLQSPRTYGYARRILLLAQYLSRTPDEPDLTAFAALNRRGGGLLVDIGANGGQSAIALGFLCPKFEILSFEPNPALWSDLDFVKRLLGRRFSYRRLGLGAATGRMLLYVPIAGNLPITTRASLSLEAAQQHCRTLGSELKQAVRVDEFHVEISRFDELNLRPDAIKIDVEGAEADILLGMRDTISAHAPIIMLECNDGDERCREFLSAFGYRFYYFNPRDRRFRDLPVENARNWFAIPRAREAEMLSHQR